MRYVLAVLACLMTGPVWAEDGVFRSYQDLREQLDPLMKSRQIAEVLTLFGGADEMTPQELQALEERVQTYFKRDFEEVALIKQAEHLNGWRQELLAYWVGTEYIYVYILMHQRDDAFLSVNFKFNSDFDEVNAAM